MNPFRLAAAAHSEAVDEVYGERLRVRPQAKGGSLTAGGDDPKRPSREVIGTVTRRPRTLEAIGVGAKSAANAALSSAAWTVSFSAGPVLDLVTGELAPLDLRAGDLVVRLDEPGEPVLRLAAPLSIPGRLIHPADEV